MITNLTVGLITPPVGVVLYAVAAVGGESFRQRREVGHPIHGHRDAGHRGHDAVSERGPVCAPVDGADVSRRPNPLIPRPNQIESRLAQRPDAKLRKRR